MKLRATDPRLLNSSTKKYRRAWLLFLALLADHGLRPAVWLEFDDRIVEFRNDQRITASHWGTELQLWNTFCLLARANSLVATVLTSWSATFVTVHTVPSLYTWPRTAIRGWERGLSCTRHYDVVMPEHASFANSPFATIGANVRTYLAAKRAQCVLLRNPKLLAILRWLLKSTADDHLLCGYSYAQYRRILDRTCAKLGLTGLHYTPHSPRSGFATELYAQGVPFDRIKALGRWASDQSLRTYLDSVCRVHRSHSGHR